MGLDAVGLTNRKNIGLRADEIFALLDRQTGQTCFEDPTVERKYQHQFKAADYRVGNIATVAALCEQVSQLLGPGSFVVQKVLYDGPHSGDHIPIDALSMLSAELDSLIRARYVSPFLQEFISKMGNLVRATNQESNPIVFC